MISQNASVASNRVPFAADMLYGLIVPKVGEVSLFTHVGNTGPWADAERAEVRDQRRGEVSNCVLT